MSPDYRPQPNFSKTLQSAESLSSGIFILSQTLEIHAPFQPTFSPSLTQGISAWSEPGPPETCQARTHLLAGLWAFYHLLQDQPEAQILDLGPQFFTPGSTVILKPQVQTQTKACWAWSMRTPILQLRFTYNQ